MISKEVKKIVEQWNKEQKKAQKRARINKAICYILYGVVGVLGAFVIAAVIAMIYNCFVL